MRHLLVVEVQLDLFLPQAKHGLPVLWTLAYAKGVRLRIMPLYGSARASAIFFDSS